MKKPVSAETSYRKFRKVIIAAIETHLATGGKLYAGGFYDTNGPAICPLTCTLGLDIVDSDRNISLEKEVANRLGIFFSHDDMWDFIEGFDHGNQTWSSMIRDRNSKFFKLGIKLRKLYGPTH